ncbi:hypothetical protein V6N11_075609 [Hibiscus sabdariffa]|uniref:RNase H type-1 domain-containing protein n=1 Tax=Hibiscus sabdariffa TaxID=183260 RepID=A0ABR2R703_9ROSI
MAFMMKIAYHLTVDNQKLWTRVLKGKYGWDGVLPLNLRKANVSRLWRGVCEIWEDFKDCISWHVRNGESTDFWYDNWVDLEGRLVNFYNRLDSPRPISVAGMTDVAGYSCLYRLTSGLKSILMERVTLQLTRRIGVKDLREEVIEILNGSSVALDGSSLVSAIVELLLRNWIVRCCHVFRESNMVADKLASVCCSYSLVAIEWSTPPPPLVDLVNKEMSNS